MNASTGRLPSGRRTASRWNRRDAPEGEGLYDRLCATSCARRAVRDRLGRTESAGHHPISTARHDGGCFCLGASDRGQWLAGRTSWAEWPLDDSVILSPCTVRRGAPASKALTACSCLQTGPSQYISVCTSGPAINLPFATRHGPSMLLQPMSARSVLPMNVRWVLFDTGVIPSMLVKCHSESAR